MSSTLKEKIVMEIAVDRQLQKVICHIRNEWPKQACPQFYSFQDVLAVADGLLLKGDQIVIPTRLRKELLRILHEGHLGIEKTRRLARQTVYWPGMNCDIAAMINDCATCLTHRDNKENRCLQT